MKPKAKTKLACEMAYMDQTKLNENISDGTYPCAPKTTPGAARIFEVEDIMALRIFAAMLALTANRERAGHVADKALNLINSSNPPKYVCHFERHPKLWSTIGIYDEGEGLPAIGLTFDLEHIRDKIMESFEYERQNQVFGSD